MIDRPIKNMPDPRRNSYTLATLETRHTSLPAEHCTHYTPTPVSVKRMGCVFNGGIPEFDDTKDPELEMQSCATCQPIARAEEWEKRIVQWSARSGQTSARTSGSNTPTSPARGLLGPVIRYKDDSISPETLYTDAGTIDEEREVGCLSMFRKR